MRNLKSEVRNRDWGARGFTMLELTFTLFIAAVLLSVSLIRISRTPAFMAEGERVARSLVADLRFAQSEAITQSKNHYLLFTQGGTKFTEYRIYRVEGTGDVQVESTRRLPDCVAVTGSATRAEFAPGGDALAGYTYGVLSVGHSYTISVVLSTGAAILTGT